MIAKLAFFSLLVGLQIGTICQYVSWALKALYFLDFSGGAVVKNPPANAGDTGSSPGPRRSHMPRSN